MENTAEEILRKYLEAPVNQAEVNDDINIIKAMNEYRITIERKLIESMLEDMKSKHCEYHQEIVEGYLDSDC